MLSDNKPLIETLQAEHKHTTAVLAVLAKACNKLTLSDLAAECSAIQEDMVSTDSMFKTLTDSSTADLAGVLADVKKFAADAVSVESEELQGQVRQGIEASSNDMSERFKKLEARVLAELGGSGGAEGEDPSTPGRMRLSGRGADAQLLKKVSNKIGDFEAQVTTQLQAMSQDIDKKLAFLGTQPRAIAGESSSGNIESVVRDLDAVKYDVGELKDLLGGTKNDTAHVKRIVLACERDMEDFTAAMDAVNVDLDEMRSRVDSTHSIITSRQRVEATVTAEISTMRLDMGDMQEALKAHDAWMEDVSQSLQEAHERCQRLSDDITELREQTQAKLDAKTDIMAWNDMNDDVDASIKTVRDMASALRLEVDSRRRKVDEGLNQLKGDIANLDSKVDTHHDNMRSYVDDSQATMNARIEERVEHSRGLEEIASKHAEIHQELGGQLEARHTEMESRVAKLEADLKKQDDEMHKEINERVDGVEKHHANISKETSKRLNAVDLRISGLQGASGEAKRDINKLRDEVNNLTVKSAAHDVDISKNSDDVRKLERGRSEDTQRHKQDMDAVYEELDQKVYEKNFQSLEDNATKLTRGVVKLCQVVGVFPGARMNDGSEEELDVDVELLNWEDCAQNLTARVEKVWRQASSQKFKSVLDLVSKKADHSVLRLLQISQQHIESQLDRVRHERELWKEVVDKRAQQPLQLALSLKDPHTGQPIPGPGACSLTPQQLGPMPVPQGAGMTRPLSEAGPDAMLGLMQGAGGLPPQPPGAGGLVGPADQTGGAMKASPLAKRIARPAGPPPKA
mmetsp:Transcript_54626/g.130358  ORF Transcript_54626/g.130358 Transcript_54626/m.130358 type:complete len:799 (-) Transcript_54626:91-2487(-)|eukprot:CAMPEP_0178413458 /NCGR_PEP_ID=MMETSP0689_2-20121128/22537_1 /TAXON_ID=160604 /ORGANISM="Amphidinium massartii, Strain CS-259" /LENGTH=798 /DNA_ID=CAMNT_0020034729 /DNA_START=85 /DNA_END=2481 /DNA_ORIENTATION=+